MILGQAAEPSFGWVYQPVYQSWDYWNSWLIWSSANLNSILLVMIFSLLLFECVLVCRNRKQARSGWRGRMHQLLGALPRMNQKRRKEYTNTLFEDGVVEFVETAVYEGRLTRDEAKDFYHRQANFCGLKGLLPRTDQAKLKQELQDKYADKQPQTEIGSTFLRALKS